MGPRSSPRNAAESHLRVAYHHGKMNNLVETKSSILFANSQPFAKPQPASLVICNHYTIPIPFVYFPM